MAHQDALAAARPQEVAMKRGASFARVLAGLPSVGAGSAPWAATCPMGAGSTVSGVIGSQGPPACWPAGRSGCKPGPCEPLVCAAAPARPSS